MRKRTSKRRWKARIRLGLWIPLEAIYNHRLERFFDRAEEREQHVGGGLYRLNLLGLIMSDVR